MTSARQRKALEKARAQQAKTVPATAFRKEELYWKNRIDHPNVENAFRPELVDWQDNHGQFQTFACKRATTYTGHQAILFNDLPGLVFLPSLLSPATQRALAKCAVTKAIARPNTTSLDPHYYLPTQDDNGTLWSMYQQDPSTRIKRKSRQSEAVLKREPTNLPAINADNYQFERAAQRQSDVTCDNSSSQSDDHDVTLPVEHVLQKLRWCSIGMAYHWGTKTYQFETQSPPIPPLIDQVCRQIVAQVPWEDVFEDDAWVKDAQRWAESYNPEGGIINFYNKKDALTAHIDHSEVDTVRPLVSISLGLDAVFLVGGPSRDVKPLALFLKSGDAVIMSGPSRRVYHGVPRVFETGAIDPEDDHEWQHDSYAHFMQTRRLNLNVRQVF